MRLSLVVLVAVATLFASGDALSANTQSGLTALTSTSSKKVQSAAAGQIDGKSFLRSHRYADKDTRSEDEERVASIITNPTRSKMLWDYAYKESIFANWLDNKLSSFTIRDYLKLNGDRWKQSYQDLYNEYALLHKKSRQYP